MGERKALSPEQGGFHLWNVHLRFGWQVGSDRIKSTCLMFFEQLVHRALARVVSRKGQPPITVMLVEKVQVPRRRARAVFGIHPLIPWPQL